MADGFTVFGSQQAVGNDLCHVHDLYPIIQLLYFHRIIKHLGALGTRHRDDPGAGIKSFLYPDSAGAIFTTAQDISEEIPAPASTAKSILSTSIHLHELNARDGF